VTLTYPALERRPKIMVNVECLLTGKIFAVPMLIDTGSDETSFPCDWAKAFGHNNQDQRVKKDWCDGVGGGSVTYLHSVQISLLHPTKKERGVIWTSTIPKTPFIEKLTCNFGLIGMDIIKQWKSIRLENARRGLQIIIKI
jgi:hypothetical protein